MNWLAVIPLKGPGQRKTRLASRLDDEQRHRLSQILFEHVSRVLRKSLIVSDVALLSNRCPDDWNGRFFRDDGRGLNIELGSLARRLRSQPWLVIHADLPFLSPADIATLIANANDVGAIASNLKGTGTNALALPDPSGFEFAFGPGSLTRHLATLQGRARIVERLGLNFDIDIPDDLDAAIGLGFPGSWRCPPAADAIEPTTMSHRLA